MDDLQDDDKFSERLDLINHRLNKCSNNLSSALLTNSILSRDLMNLNSEIIDYDSKVNQLNYDAACAQEYLSKLEGLTVRAQFFEAQIDALESHARYRGMGTHKRVPSVNDLKDEVLDLKTTETTLDNLYHEYAYLKRRFVQFSGPTSLAPDYLTASPMLDRIGSINYVPDAAGYRTPVQNQAESFFHERPQRKQYNTNVNNNNNHIASSSISTTATSLFDETTNLRPLRCSSKRKRYSTNTLCGNFNEAPIPMTEDTDIPNIDFNETNTEGFQNLFANDKSTGTENEDSSLQDINSTVVKHKKRKSVSVPSFKDLISSSKYQGDLFETCGNAKKQLEVRSTKSKSLKHFKSCQGLKIRLHSSESNDPNEVNFDFHFPSSDQPTTQITKVSNIKIHNKSSQYENQKQTFDWLSKISATDTVSDIEESSPIKRRHSMSVEVTPILHSNVFHSTGDVSKTSQALLLDMMNRQQENEGKLAKLIEIENSRKQSFGSFDSKFFYSKYDFINSLSKNLYNLQISKQFQSAATPTTPTIPEDLNESDSSSSNLQSVSSRNISSVATGDYPQTENNINAEKKQWGLMLSKFLNASALGNIFDASTRKDGEIQTIDDSATAIVAENEDLDDEVSKDCISQESEVHLEPVVENKEDFIIDLQQALETDLLIE
ncbi:hypothetical protein DASC09_015020 [Saccharomycopsis crataegensis]|uniref:Uncharacterized protein n=1 Tax=Saccharomycopsis crataegensis TaxID=43959 RepID=A0AAV5QHT3_9ASCO|nr:hypothetical protein DASC09_015020 [Saccharomycopsis crataegensis]